MMWQTTSSSLGIRVFGQVWSNCSCVICLCIHLLYICCSACKDVKMPHFVLWHCAGLRGGNRRCGDGVTWAVAMFWNVTGWKDFLWLQTRVQGWLLRGFTYCYPRWERPHHCISAVISGLKGAAKYVYFMYVLAGRQWLLGLALNKDVADAGRYLYIVYYWFYVVAGHQWLLGLTLNKNVVNTDKYLDTVYDYSYFVAGHQWLFSALPWTRMWPIPLHRISLILCCSWSSVVAWPYSGQGRGRHWPIPLHTPPAEVAPTGAYRAEYVSAVQLRFRDAWLGGSSEGYLCII